jgi:hypothetical protein
VPAQSVSGLFEDIRQGPADNTLLTRRSHNQSDEVGSRHVVRAVECNPILLRKDTCKVEHVDAEYMILILRHHVSRC